MRLRCLLIVLAVAQATPAAAQTVYPVDRAEILAGARFDFKVEFESRVDPASVEVLVNGEPPARVFGRAPDFVEREGDQEQSALLLRGASLAGPGPYRVTVSDGVRRREVSWSVYGTGPRRAKNVILFVGDGLSLAHRIGARLLSKGIVEGRANGRLAMDDMPHMALVATAGTDSIITDSANAASAFATGHKTAVNAMGVYADRTPDPFDDPRVETITSLAKRKLGLAVGIVTNTGLEDATPAAFVAHTRRRFLFDRIVDQYVEARPDVLMGGGGAYFTPRGTPGSRRRDETDATARFRDAGYVFAATATELRAVAQKADTERLLGLFNTGNMDGALDRRLLKQGSVPRFPDQPDLTEQLAAALQVLERKPAGFFLMVESGMIDKYTHLLDMERAVYDTIMLDNAVRLAREWSAARGDDTLILVVSDHAHPIALIGTIDDDMASTPQAPLRERIGVYDKAAFPNYPPADKDGYPPRVDVSRRLVIGSASSPDYYETFRPRLDGPNEPTRAGTTRGSNEPNERYRQSPGSMLRIGNLPRMVGSSVHSGEDVVLTASGPGSDRVRGQLDNTDVFRIMAEALGLGAGR